MCNAACQFRKVDGQVAPGGCGSRQLSNLNTPGAQQHTGGSGCARARLVEAGKVAAAPVKTPSSPLSIASLIAPPAAVSA